MQTSTIKLVGEVSPEKYEMAVRVLEAIGLPVEYDGLSDYEIEGIEEGLRQMEEGKTVPSSEVHRMAELLCTEK
ncbi:hypothetical protein SAMN05443429_103149 [Cruoricaptor ignavus]|uniref:Uncharacterized protein n=2 Tax=Cruoricaptor ignavus TaxID=1118202 RepID=A0A1M6D830_9FLAO|nr:hypothetical protein [Cruoricaptor ignavus]QOR73562.1 hypothetical protein IMZ16_08590 [Cruoricaptor ignavus]SHI69311.1 hypothetical protein SAMN05443429_103149 [Cruoricaptor ignavus]